MITNTSSHSNENGRYGHIDALRGIAALLVVVTHVSSPYFAYGVERPIVQWVDATVDLGRVGVVLFFAVSGFVIPLSLRGSRAEGARRFLIRRFFRLYPAYWLSVAATAIVIGRIWGKAWPDLETLVGHITMVQEFLGYSSIIGLYWTLQTELVFYAICLAIFMLGLIDKPRTWILMIAITALLLWLFTKSVDYLAFADAVGTSQTKAKYVLAQFLVGTPRGTYDNARFLLILHLSIMAFGSLLRFWYEGKVRAPLDRLFLFAVFIYWLVFHSGPTLVNNLATPAGWSEARTYLSYSIPVAAFAVFGCVIPIRSRALAYIGVISYSLYLFHPIPLYAFHSVLKEFPALTGIPILVRDIAIGLMSIGLAGIIYLLIEKPAIDLGRRLSRSVEPPRRAQVVPAGPA